MSRKPDAWPGDEPDWYGEKSKRKNDQPVRNERLWGMVSILASLAVIVAGCAIISLIVINPFNQRETLIISTTIPTQVAVVPTPSPFPRPTFDPATPIPTVSMPALPEAMELQIFDQGGNLISSLYTSSWKPGYLLRGLSWGGGEFVAQTHGVSGAACEEFDTYWSVSNGRRPLPNFGKMVNPKAILQMGDWTIILATNCVRQGAALFLIDINGNLRDEFPIIGGDSLVKAEGRIFVSLSGFAGGDQQNHWIELKITEDESPKLAQVDQFVLDEASASYRSAAYHAGIGLVFIRVNAGVEFLQIAELTESTLTVRKSVSMAVAVTDLQFNSAGELFALDRRNKSILKFDNDLSNYTTIPLKGITPYSFALDSTGKFVIAGYTK